MEVGQGDLAAVPGGVVSAAEQDHVVAGSRAAVGEGAEVVGVAEGWGSAAAAGDAPAVSGGEGAAGSHISGRAMKYPDEAIEAEAMLYLRFKDGKIVFAQNFHDSKPFAPFLRQISEG